MFNVETRLLPFGCPNNATFVVFGGLTGGFEADEGFGSSKVGRFCRMGVPVVCGGCRL